ncbi:kinesin-like protein KIFC2 [Gopherus evgoodei]|uniref:kinesin-like protein KIFC2 n=1 Tax=Gopherus evgoodei TaxID=1825980 RepID=UPI0011D00809|nr:kinesin-like protein KIFC2 [Gopherus evgoodei]
MFAFYSLLVYIVYALLRRGPRPLPPPQGLDAFSVELPRRRRLCEELWPELPELDSSSESDRGSGTGEEEEAGPDSGFLEDATTPLTEFLSLKREAAEGKLCPVDTEASGGKLPDSPLISVMSHLLSFLEHYGQMQRLQEQAREYRSRLRREESRCRKQLRTLRRAYKQQVQDKLSIIESLEGVICEQQNVMETLHGKKPPSTCPLYPCPPVTPVGVHRLVESISALHGERNKLLEEITGLKQQLEEGEREKQQLAGSFGLQVQELKQQIEEREEELTRLRTGMGVTDSEKRIHNLTMENEGLKQSLSVTQGLLQQLATVSAQPSATLAKENEGLRSRVQHLETCLQQKLEELVRLEGQVSALQWRKEQEVSRLDERIQELQRMLETQQNRPPDVQYVTQTVEVESPTTLRSLVEAEERNRGLLEQLSSQGERCQQLAEQLQGSEEVTAELRHKISAYESEIAKLREELLREISHLEAQKEEAVKEASESSEQHLEHLREQLTGVQRRLAMLQPLLKDMKTNYASLRSQVCDFSEFYEAAIREARRQMCLAVSEASETSRDLLQKYQHEVLLRKKYHSQLVELKGNIRVLCRLKPVTEVDQREGEVSTAVSTEPGSDSSVTTRYKGKERTFELDKVFLPEATQEEVFLEIEPLVLSCLDGYNVCIFAYGQTGSGKTYTMEGVPEDPGINQRALQALYQEMEARAGLWKYSVTLSMVEIYNEVIRDLLGKEPQEKLDIKLNPDGSGQLHVPGLTSVEVQGLREIRKMLSLGKRNRATYCTNMNERSSRSHALLTITITGTNCSTGTKTSGKLNLVDLAGSERVWKSGAQGERLKEAQSINKSLLALGEVIQALRARQGHVPFRNSKLTYLLQDSLGKGNKTVMMVQISLLEKNAGETMCSLKFAQRVCKVELGPASRRIDSWGQSEL